MADTTNNESISEIVPKTLGKHLVGSVSSLREYYQEFPSANRKLRMPSISVFVSSAPFRAITPYLKKEVTPADITNSKANVLWVVGIYDFTMQVDLWARTKEERDDLTDQLFNALNPNINPMGVVLPMEEYFGQLCDYVYNGHETNDSEERSQRDEWRMTFNVLATCRAIRTEKAFIIEQTQTSAELEADGEIS